VKGKCDLPTSDFDLNPSYRPQPAAVEMLYMCTSRQTLPRIPEISNARYIWNTARPIKCSPSHDNSFMRLTPHHPLTLERRQTYIRCVALRAHGANGKQFMSRALVEP
jgi:hypothetical protein